MLKKIIKISFVLLLLVGTAVAYVYFGVFEQKVNTDGKESVCFYVKSNSTFDDLVNGLVEN